MSRCWFLTGLNILLGCAVLAFGSVGHAHPSGDRTGVRLAVAQWAAGLQGENEVAVGRVLDDQFTAGGQDKASYLSTLGKFPTVKIVQRYAQYDVSGDQAKVSPVVIYPNRQIKNPVALTLNLGKRGSDWKIVSIGPAPHVPQELLPTNYPLQHILHDVQISVCDKASGAPAYSRVNIRDGAGEYWPPQFHRKVIPTGWREDIGGDVIVGGKTFAYVKPDFVAPLPVGKYILEIESGIEYEPERLEFEVSASKIPSLKVEMKRWTHMSQDGWYSGDSHVHFLDPQTALVEAQAEDLNVINVLASSGGDLVTSVNHFTGEPSVHSTEENIVYIGEETRHDYLGHTSLLNIDNLIYPMGWGVPNTGVPGAYDFPTMAHQADRAHANGGLVTWTHFPNPYGELPIDFALGKIDAAEIVVFGDPFDESLERSPARTWYRLLNTGINVPALGGADKMWNTQIVGGVRTYVRVEGEFTYQSWIDGAKAGRTFVSTDPMLTFSVDGKEIGDTINLEASRKLSIHAEVNSRRPVDRIEILVNGEIVAVKENPKKKKRVTIDGDVQVDESSWIAARVYSSERLPIQGDFHSNLVLVSSDAASGVPVLAHTSPIYVEMNGRARQSAEDARFLADWCARTIEWARTQGRYHNEQQRQDVIDLYTEAKGFYLAQIEDR